VATARQTSCPRAVPFTYRDDSSDFMLVITAIGMSGRGLRPGTVPAAWIFTVSRISSASGPGESWASTDVGRRYRQPVQGARADRRLRVAPNDPWAHDRTARIRRPNDRGPMIGRPNPEREYATTVVYSAIVRKHREPDIE